MIHDLRRSEAMPLLPPEVAGIADEICRAGFGVVVRAMPATDSPARCQLSGRGRPGAFFVSAPTEAEAFALALAEARVLLARID